MPEDRTTFVSNFCSLGPRPNVMTGLMRLLLIDHFSSADNVETPFKDRLFQPSASGQTGIAIDDALVWNPTRTEKRPAVIIKRNDWDSVRKATFENRTGLTPEGYFNYTKFWTGSHTLYCLAKEGPEVELLAAEVYRFLLHFGPVFRQYFDLMTFEMMKVGAVHRIEESKDHYAVPITIGYGWAESWIIKVATPRIRTVKLSQLFQLGTQ